MFVNARRCLVKSVADPGIREGMRCVNHSNKTVLIIRFRPSTGWLQNYKKDNKKCFIAQNVR
jgi:hypothetical protein